MMLTPKVSNVYNTNRKKPCDAEGIEPTLTEISPVQRLHQQKFLMEKSLNLMTLGSVANNILTTNN
jgi:hypothetical protein